MADRPQYSIHPRVSFPNGEKYNTCEPYKKAGKGKLGKKMKRLSDRRLAHATTLKSLPSNQNPAAFKTPGSMKGH
jgi:hypothetical protein